MTADTLAAPRSPQVRKKGANLEKWGWVYMRASGVLLVVLIFLMLTTTYSRLTELKINLPTANAQAAKNRPKELNIIVSADGRSDTVAAGDVQHIRPAGASPRP